MVLVYHKPKILHHRSGQKSGDGKARLRAALKRLATDNRPVLLCRPLTTPLSPRAERGRDRRSGIEQFLLRNGRIGIVAAFALLAGCDPVQIIEGSATHVSIRYDGLVNGLDKATQMAQSACARHGRTAKLRRTYQEGLGIGERFAFFECV